MRIGLYSSPSCHPPGNLLRQKKKKKTKPNKNTHCWDLSKWRTPSVPKHPQISPGTARPVFLDWTCLLRKNRGNCLLVPLWGCVKGKQTETGPFLVPPHEATCCEDPPSRVGGLTFARKEVPTEMLDKLYIHIYIYIYEVPQ